MKGIHGWMILVGLVVVFDLAAGDGETLSESVHRGIEKHPVLISAAVGTTTAHLLLGGHPVASRIDPFRALGLARRVLRLWTPS